MKKGFMLLELFVVLVIIIIAFAVLVPMTGRMRRTSFSYKCADNLAGVGQAMNVYAEDFGGSYPKSGPANAYWARKIGWNYEAKWPDHKSDEYDGAPVAATVTSSWYLLVKYCELYPYDFLCNASKDEGFEFSSHYNDFRGVWDFGDNPYQHCSYSMQNPFGKFPATPDDPADKPVASDKNPWFDSEGYILEAAGMNTTNHKGKGQNILFGDLHVDFSKTSEAGIEGDDIFTFSEDNIFPTARDEDDGSQTEDDSFLVM